MIGKIKTFFLLSYLLFLKCVLWSLKRNILDHLLTYLLWFSLVMIIYYQGYNTGYNKCANQLMLHINNYSELLDDHNEHLIKSNERLKLMIQIVKEQENEE